MGFKIEDGVLEQYTKGRGVTEVIIPDSVTKIGWDPFKGCTSLNMFRNPSDF